ncbi:MAG: glycosyltransferase family A protein, partial [Planctomycetota bacterium]
GSALIEEKQYVPYGGGATGAPAGDGGASAKKVAGADTTGTSAVAAGAGGLDRLDYSHIGLTMVASYYFERDGSASLTEMLREYAAYPTEILDRVQFVLIDDGSPVPVEVPRDLDLNLLLLRIDADIPWNWAGGRNLGAVCARSEKVLFTDIDHRFPEVTLRRLLAMGNPGRSLFRFHRRRADGSRLGVPTNIHCMSRGRFLRWFGYDEELCGHYGSDPMFFQWHKLHGTRLRRLPERFPCVLRERHAEDAGHSLSRNETRSREIRRRNVERIRRYGEDAGHSRSFLCFPWRVVADLHRSAVPAPVREDRGWARRWWFRWLLGGG